MVVVLSIFAFYVKISTFESQGFNKIKVVGGNMAIRWDIIEFLD
jgi:hypothetical protein